MKEIELQFAMVDINLLCRKKMAGVMLGPTKSLEHWQTDFYLLELKN